MSFPAAFAIVTVVMAGKKSPLPRYPSRAWKAAPSPLGTGLEIQNYASPLAQELWYYVRSMGRVIHAPGWNCNHQPRDGYLLHVMLGGVLTYRVRGQSYLVKRGQACFMDFQNEVDYAVGGRQPAEFWWVWFNGKDLPRLFLTLGADHDPVFPLRDLTETFSLLRRLRMLTLREPPGYELRSSGVLTLLLAELFTSRADRIEALSFGARGQAFSIPIRRAIDYVVRRYDEGIGVKDMAMSARQSLTYFSRRFHKEVGISPVTYLTRYRIEQAKKFLASSNESIEQIARSVGFNSLSRFSAIFTQIVGVAPLAFRRDPSLAQPSA